MDAIDPGMRANLTMNILSVDIGTSSVRAGLVNAALQIDHIVSRALQLDTDAGGKAELDVEKALEKTLACLREALSWAETNTFQVEAISFSSASASLVCLDKDFNPLRPALTFADLRGSEESQWIINTFGRKAFIQTGAPVHASYWLPKLLWLQHQGLTLEGLRLCTIKDLLIYRLSGEFLIDACNAAALGMMDVSQMKWDDLSLKIAGINTSQLPEIQATTTLLKVKKDRQSLFSTSSATPQLVLGAMDGVLASLGAGAFRPGQVTTSLGSSGACRIAAERPLIDPQEWRIWSYPLTQSFWVRGGAMNNGGLVTQWLAENFSQSREASTQGYQEMFAAAEKQPPGASGLIFLPYLFGERAPIYDERARGVFFGLHSGHHRGHFARAGLEGIFYALFAIFEILQASQKDVGELRGTGGYVQSDLMLQIQADIFGQPILIPSEHEGSVIGAAALAQKALGKIADFHELEGLLTIQTQFTPNEKARHCYQEQFSRFKSLYENLKPLF